MPVCTWLPKTRRSPAGGLARALLWCAAAMAAPAGATPEIFREADVALGEQLLKEHACAACHTRRVGGDGSAIYRPQGRIGTPAALRGMVELCSVELKLSLFPEEVTAVAAVLNRDHYRFGVAPKPRPLP
jgi:hypothetical protein